MPEICFQKIKGLAVPYTLDDADTWASFKDNQVIKGKVTGTTQEPSFLMPCTPVMQGYGIYGLSNYGAMREVLR